MNRDYCLDCGCPTTICCKRKNVTKIIDKTNVKYIHTSYTRQTPIRCQVCKKGYLRGDTICRQCHYNKIIKSQKEIWKLREEVVLLKEKLRKVKSKMNCKNCEHELVFHKSTMEDYQDTWQHIRGHGLVDCSCRKPMSKKEAEK